MFQHLIKKFIVSGSTTSEFRKLHVNVSHSIRKTPAFGKGLVEAKQGRVKKLTIIIPLIVLGSILTVIGVKKLTEEKSSDEEEKLKEKYFDNKVLNGLKARKERQMAEK